MYAHYAHSMHMHIMNKMSVSYGLFSASQHEWSGQVTHVKLLFSLLRVCRWPITHIFHMDEALAAFL